MMRSARRRISLRAFTQACRTHALSRWAASIAFFAFLSLCPALLAFFAGLALWWHGVDPERGLSWLLAGLPQDAASLIRGEARRMSESPPPPLGLGLAASLLGSLWSGSRGVAALMQGVAAVYGLRERSGMAHRVRALALSLAGLALGGLTLAAVVWVPLLLRWVHLDAALDAWLGWGRWPLLGAAFLVGLVGLYRFSPARDADAPLVVWPGASLACAGLLLGSALFARLVASTERWHFTYGALTGVISLLLWLQGSAWLTLAGAVWNGLLEKRPSEARLPVDVPTPR